MTFDDMHKSACTLLLNWRRNKTPPRCSSLSPPLAKASAGSPPAEAYLTEKVGTANSRFPTLLSKFGCGRQFILRVSGQHYKKSSPFAHRRFNPNAPLM